jgi:plastocyanin
MKKSLLVLVLLLFTVMCVSAANLQITVTDLENNPVSDAVVTATPINIRVAKRTLKSMVVDQVDKEFVGSVTVVPAGTPVNFPNNDNIRHHVYSFSPAKQFELPLYTGTPAKPVVFDKQGVVKLGCNIHDWMVGYIYITDAPYFITTDSEGKAQLANLPAGSYTLKLWHPRMNAAEESTRKSIEFVQAEGASANWQLELKPDFRPRRAPLPLRQGY